MYHLYICQLIKREQLHMQWVECITICLEEETSALAIAIVILGQITPFTSQQYCIANLIYKAHDHLRFIRVRNILLAGLFENLHQR